MKYNSQQFDADSQDRTATSDSQYRIATWLLVAVLIVGVVALVVGFFVTLSDLCRGMVDSWAENSAHVVIRRH